jgi:hypothetical protein
MPPIHILNFPSRLPSQFLVHINAFPLLITAIHPEQQHNTQDQNRATRAQIQAVTNLVVRSVKRQETPCGDQTANIAEHDCHADCGCACCVGDDVGGCVGVAQRAEREGSRGD